MRTTFRFTLLACSLALAGGAPAADGLWQRIGDLHLPETRAVGQISLNLDSLRNRGGYYEIWERIDFAVPPAERRGIDLPGDVVAQRLTLWGVRCRSGTLARLTWREAGAFVPRIEAPRFLLPAPDGVGKVIIETVCDAVARRQLGELSLPSEEPPLAASPEQPLDLPPSLPLTVEADEGED